MANKSLKTKDISATSNRILLTFKLKPLVNLKTRTQGILEEISSVALLSPACSSCIITPGYKYTVYTVGREGLAQLDPLTIKMFDTF